MEHMIQFLLHHGYSVIFVWVFVEQLGLPVPSAPALLAMGALAGRGEFSFWLTLALATLASLGSDFFWFELGRHRGHNILNQLCRISLEPDSCVRRTQNLFIRYGARSLLVAKFVPGLGAVAAPLAGMFGVPALGRRGSPHLGRNSHGVGLPVQLAAGAHRLLRYEPGIGSRGPSRRAFRGLHCLEVP